MSKIKNEVGNVYGRLTVIEEAGRKRRQVTWLCRCECGNEVVVTGGNLRSGNTKSCGCLQSDINIKRSTKHGQSHTRTYEIWLGMIKRCTNPNAKHYKDYGGRGIKVCNRWMDFANFYADMGNAPPGMSIDRIDNDGDYTPENCRWADDLTQARNSRHCHMLTHNGETHCITEWAELINIKPNTIHSRLRLGWSVSKTLSTPTILMRRDTSFDPSAVRQ